MACTNCMFDDYLAAAKRSKSHKPNTTSMKAVAKKLSSS